MADLMVVVGTAPDDTVGTKLQFDRFVSKAPRLAKLARDGRLFLVALRPPPERLWLVTILERLTLDGGQWTATTSDMPITDVTELRSKLAFADGKGWINWCDSCRQTHFGTDPRALAADDVALLEAAAGIAGADHAADTVTIGSGTRHGVLLDTILDNPASEDARRVYADQLLADNDLRGEYILVDIALAGPLSIRKRAELAARRAHLLAHFSSIWWPYVVQHRETQKGFLRAVHGTWEQMRAVAPELFAREPVTEVGISKLQAGVAELLAAPWLPRLETLRLRDLPGDEAFAELVRSPQLSQLRSLNVCGNNLGPLALATLANALPRVDNLALTGNPIENGGVEHLRAWHHLPNITTLYLSDCQIGAGGLDRLLDGAQLPLLTTLALSFNDLGDEGVAALVKHAARLPALERLELKSCAISAAGANALATALPKLRRLDVRRNELDGELDDPRIVA